jgi:hypothetical protein
MRSLRRAVRRRRRPLAALLAGSAAALALVAVRSSPPAEPGSTALSDPSSLRAGEVIVPLSVGAAANALDVGDVIDLVSVPEGESAVVIASHARVVEGAVGGSALSGASSVILVAVAEAQALPLSSAAAQGPMSVVIRSS